MTITLTVTATLHIENFIYALFAHQHYLATKKETVKTDLATHVYLTLINLEKYLGCIREFVFYYILHLVATFVLSILCQYYFTYKDIHLWNKKVSRLLAQ